MKVTLTLVFSLLAITGIALCQTKDALLLDDFEGLVLGGPDGTVDFGSGGGSTVEVSAETQIKQSGNQSLKAVYNAVTGGYMWVARGSGLDVKNAGWLVSPESIDWPKFNAVSFYVFGSNSGARVAFDVKDKGLEVFRFLTTDDFTGWKQIVAPFSEFSARSDWQPDSAEKNGALDFPLKSYQFEILPEAKGTLFFDKVELANK